MSEPLATYLNDHLAGARFAIDMLERLQDARRDEEFKKFTQDLLCDIEQDRAVLQGIAVEVSGGQSAVKEAAAWLSEKVSRLKLQLDDNDDLSLFEALEALSLGVLGKLKLWQSLSEISDRDPRLTRIDLGRLVVRAQSQHDAIEVRRRRLAATVLSRP
jgi:hypothetical protein